MEPKKLNYTQALAHIIASAWLVVDSADNEGCSDDLTVVSNHAIEELKYALQEHQREAQKHIEDTIKASEQGK